MKLKGRSLSPVPGWLVGLFVFSKYCAMFTATVGRYYPCFVIDSLVRDTEWERQFAVHIQKRTGAVLALNSSNMSPKEGTESGLLFRAWQEAIELMSGWRRTLKGSRVPLSSLLVYPLSLAQSRELSSPEDRVIFCVCPVLSLCLHHFTFTCEGLSLKHRTFPKPIVRALASRSKSRSWEVAANKMVATQI